MWANIRSIFTGWRIEKYTIKKSSLVLVSVKIFDTAMATLQKTQINTSSLTFTRISMVRVLILSSIPGQISMGLVCGLLRGVVVNSLSCTECYFTYADPNEWPHRKTGPLLLLANIHWKTDKLSSVKPWNEIKMQSLFVLKHQNYQGWAQQ